MRLGAWTVFRAARISPFATRHLDAETVNTQFKVYTVSMKRERKSWLKNHIRTLETLHDKPNRGQAVPNPLPDSHPEFVRSRRKLIQSGKLQNM